MDENETRLCPSLRLLLLLLLVLLLASESEIGATNSAHKSRQVNVVWDPAAIVMLGLPS